jgi:hypothetical protein
MSIVKKLFGWLRPATEPETEAEREHLRDERETIRTSQLGQGTIVPSTSDITDPKPWSQARRLETQAVPAPTGRRFRARSGP